MTGREAADLRLLWEFVQEWRREDGEWKQTVDNRLRLVEGFVTGSLAERRASSRAKLSRNQRVGLFFAAVSATGGLILGILNFLT